MQFIHSEGITFAKVLPFLTICSDFTVYFLRKCFQFRKNFRILEEILTSCEENFSKLNNRPGTIIRYPRVCDYILLRS